MWVFHADMYKHVFTFDCITKRMSQSAPWMTHSVGFLLVNS